MGNSKYVDRDMFPRQGVLLHKKVLVCFHYDTTKTIEGEIVRDDIEGQFVTIIKLVDNRYILATECQFTIK